MGLEKKRCPDCGRFRTLTLEGMMECPEHPYGWMCTNPDCFEWGVVEPDPDYDWRYWGIPEEEMLRLRNEEPELYEAFMEMKLRYEHRGR